MKRVAALCCLSLLVLSCAQSARPTADIRGIRLGMSRDEAQKILRQRGELEKEERKQQEVWALKNDDSYSHLIVAYNKEYTAVRFITAVAKDQGRRVPYSDVIDTQKAKLTEAGNSRTYALEVPASEGQPGYLVRAIGTDPAYLKYYSVERTE